MAILSFATDLSVVPTKSATPEERARWAIGYLRKFLAGEKCAEKLLKLAVAGLEETVDGRFGRLTKDGRRVCAYKARVRGVERSCVSPHHGSGVRHYWRTASGEYRSF